MLVKGGQGGVWSVRLRTEVELESGLQDELFETVRGGHATEPGAGRDGQGRRVAGRREDWAFVGVAGDGTGRKGCGISLLQTPASIFYLPHNVRSRVRPVVARLKSVNPRSSPLYPFVHSTTPSTPARLLRSASSCQRILPMLWPNLRTGSSAPDPFPLPAPPRTTSPQAVEIRELIIRCLSQMILARVTNVKSGWKSMFMVFTTAANDRDPMIVRWVVGGSS